VLRPGHGGRVEALVHQTLSDVLLFHLDLFELAAVQNALMSHQAVAAELCLLVVTQAV